MKIRQIFCSEIFEFFLKNLTKCLNFQIIALTFLSLGKVTESKQQNCHRGIKMAIYDLESSTSYWIIFLCVFVRKLNLGNV